MNPDGSLEQNLDEPNYVIDELKKLGMPIINITIANPYYEPHYGRSTTLQSSARRFSEHPLHGVARFVSLTAKLQSKTPAAHVIGTGYSGSGNERPTSPHGQSPQTVSMVGMGRITPPTPAAPKDIATEQKLNPSRSAFPAQDAHRSCAMENTQDASSERQNIRKAYQLAKSFAR